MQLLLPYIIIACSILTVVKSAGSLYDANVLALAKDVPVEGINSIPLVNLYRTVKNLGWPLFGKTSTPGRFLNKAKQQNKLQPVVPSEVPFPCSTIGTRSEKKPKTVHELRPGDIDVIGALGDSLTAGNGITATNFISVVFGENRGLAFTIGGQGNWRQYLTLPNILKMFNPKLIGYSLGDSLTTHRASQFNVAEGGAVSRNTPYMAKLLVQRITKDPRVNVKEDWKMITYLIGGNDFCSEMCYYKNPVDIIAKHKEDVLSVLRTLRDNLPRTIVNFIPAPHLELLTNYNSVPDQCHITYSVSCPCIYGAGFKNYQKIYDQIMRLWQIEDFKLAILEEFDRDDFTVVFHPVVFGYRNPGQVKTGKTDYSYTSDDCFHFSQKGNAHLANLLWNNIMEPVGQKAVQSTDLFEKFNCPTPERPFIFTNRNSGITDLREYGRKLFKLN